LGTSQGSSQDATCSHIPLYDVMLQRNVLGFMKAL
jgi:hypothetical protein